MPAPDLCLGIGPFVPLPIHTDLCLEIGPFVPLPAHPTLCAPASGPAPHAAAHLACHPGGEGRAFPQDGLFWVQAFPEEGE